MSLLNYLMGRQPKSASLAKERLQVIIARTGNRDSNPELLLQIKQAIVEAVSRFVDVSQNDISVELGNDKDLEVLSVNVALPEKIQQRARAA